MYSTEIKKVSRYVCIERLGVLVSSLSAAAAVEYVFDLVLYHSLDRFASRFEVLTRVEMIRMRHEVFTDASGHCKTEVGVDVDLADCHLSGLTELFLGNADCAGHIATVGIDLLNEFLGNRRRTVENDGETGKFLHTAFEYVECQGRRNEDTFLVTCALLGFELVCTVRSTDRDSQAVATGLAYKVNNLFGACICVVLGNNVVLNTCEDTKLALNSYIVLVSILNNFLCESNVLLVGEV